MGSLIKDKSCKITQILPQCFLGPFSSYAQPGEGLPLESREFGLKLSSSSSSRPTPATLRAWTRELATHQSVFYGANEELGAVGVGARIGHGQRHLRKQAG